jgi:hypothetical protein
MSVVPRRVIPGTYGGFPGGYSVARRAVDRLTDHPKDIFLRDLVSHGAIITVICQSRNDVRVRSLAGPSFGQIDEPSDDPFR